MVRLATIEDIFYITRGLQNKETFNTPQHARTDIANSNLYVCERNGKIIGSIALVLEEEHNYYAIKRAQVYNKKNCHTGVINELFQYVLSLNKFAYGCTPWEENTAILHLMDKYGFSFEKVVCEKYLVYTKKN